MAKVSLVMDGNEEYLKVSCKDLKPEHKLLLQSLFYHQALEIEYFDEVGDDEYFDAVKHSIKISETMENYMDGSRCTYDDVIEGCFDELDAFIKSIC